MVSNEHLKWAEVFYTRETKKNDYARRINGMEMLKKINAVKAMREESE